MRALAHLLLVPSLLVLTACGGGGEPTPKGTAQTPQRTSAAPTEVPTRSSPSTSPTPSPSATVPPQPAGVEVTYRCEGQTYLSMEDAWTGMHCNCIDTKAAGMPSARERAAVRLAYGKEKVTPRDVGILYGACGSNNPDWPLISAGDTNSAAWAQELRGAVMLCPNHPRIDQVKPALAATDAQVERDRSRMVDGTHIVGPGVRPGTYVATPTGPCYWERTDADGYIIDNNFSNGARVEFTILESDYSVSVQGCGDWRRAS